MNGNQSLDSRYFDWLYAKVAAVTIRNPARSYSLLFEQLYDTEFAWKVANDDNRAEDARELRDLFCEETNTRAPLRWLRRPCSMLELFMALAERAAFQIDEAPDVWFWNILDNLGLGQFSDAVYLDGNAHKPVKDILNRVIDRTYDRNGNGGMFPLKHAREDQRQVEIWHQMSAYLLERV